MRSVFLLFILFVEVGLSHAQELDTAQVYDMLLGIRQDDVKQYEISGYSILHQKLKYRLSEKTMKYFRKLYGYPKDTQPSTVRLKGNYKLFESPLQLIPEPKHGKYYYVYPAENGESFVVGFNCITKRDTNLEHFILEAIRYNLLPDSIYNSVGIDSIKFAGRGIKLGPICSRINPHNVQCPYYGQMNWSEFRDSSRAVEALAFQINLNQNKALSKEIDSKEIEILFEGIKTKAIRSEIKIKLPKIVTAGSNRLTVYYVNAKVRNRYVSCVLSHYPNDYINEDGLPSLLGEVMELIP